MIERNRQSEDSDRVEKQRNYLQLDIVCGIAEVELRRRGSESGRVSQILCEERYLQEKDNEHKTC